MGIVTTIAPFGLALIMLALGASLTLNDFNGNKKIHPELKDVKPGEELLVFKVEEEKD